MIRIQYNFSFNQSIIIIIIIMLCFCPVTRLPLLTLILLALRIWWAPNNVSKWQMGFNSAFRELNIFLLSENIWNQMIIFLSRNGQFLKISFPLLKLLQVERFEKLQQELDGKEYWKNSVLACMRMLEQVLACMRMLEQVSPSAVVLTLELETCRSVS